MKHLNGKRFNMIKLSYVLFIYPLFYIVPTVRKNIGPNFENLYFLLLLISIFILSSHRSCFKIYRKDFIICKYLLILVLISLYNYRGLNYIKPQVFIIFIFTFFLFLGLSQKQNKITVNFNLFIYLFILTTFITLLSSNYYTPLGRFYGFIGSPTVLTVFLDLYIIVFFFTNNSKITSLFIYFIVFYIHIKAQTRLNLMYLTVLPMMIKIISNFKLRIYKVFILFLFILSLNFLYPIYQFYTETSESNLAASRYEDGRDASFGLRLAMYNVVLLNLANSNLTTLLVGHGSEYTRELIFLEYNKDLLPHNDFLRLLTDFGVIFLVIYLIVIFKIALKNNLSYILTTLYFLSFYHNMVFSFFIFSIMIISYYYGDSFNRKTMF